MSRPHVHPAFYFVGLALFSLVLYWPSIFFDFDLFDTPQVLTTHPSLYVETSLLASIREMFRQLPREEPLLLRDLTWALDARLFGFQNPLGYHLGNVLLNALNTFLLGWVLFRTTGRLVFSAVTTLLWAVLPVHVEAVSWIMGRKDMLVTAMTLLAFWAQTEALRRPDRRRLGRVLYFLTILLAGFAGLAKSNGLVVFALLFLHRRFFGVLSQTPPQNTPREPIWRSVLLYTPHFALSLSVFVWYKRIISSWGVILASEPSPLSLTHLHTLFDYLPWVYAKSFKLMAVAKDYSVHYKWPNLRLPLDSTELWISKGLWLLFIAMLLLAMWKSKTILYVMLSFLTMMLPYSSIVYVAIWNANRYLYLSSAMVACLVVGAGLELSKRHARMPIYLTLALTLVSVSYAAANRGEQLRWENDIALAYSLGQSPDVSVNGIRRAASATLRMAKLTTGETRAAHLKETKQLVDRAIREHQALDLHAHPEYGDRDSPVLANVYDILADYMSVTGATPTERYQTIARAFSLQASSDRATNAAQVTFLAAAQKPETDPRPFLLSAFRLLDKALDLAMERDEVRNVLLVLDRYQKQLEPVREEEAKLRERAKATLERLPPE